MRKVAFCVGIMSLFLLACGNSEVYQSDVQENEEPVMAAADSLVLNATPEDGLVQIYDRVIPMRLFYRLNSVTQEGFIYTLDEGKQFRNVDTRIPWSTVEQCINETCSSTTLELNAEDYNSDKSVGPGKEEYIRLKDSEGVTVYCVYAYNAGESAVRLADC